MKIDKLIGCWYGLPALVRGIVYTIIALGISCATKGFDHLLIAIDCREYGWMVLVFFSAILFLKLFSIIAKDRMNLKNLAIRDELTGLYTRRFMASEFSSLIISRANRDENVIFMLYIDLDNLKSINDNISHTAGDVALKKTASIISSMTRDRDIVTRVGGDEFVVVGTVESEAEAEKIRERMEAAFSTVLVEIKNGVEIRLSVSIGLATTLPNINEVLEFLITEADKDMYQRKSAKKAAGSR